MAVLAIGIKALAMLGGMQIPRSLPSFKESKVWGVGPWNPYY